MANSSDSRQIAASGPRAFESRAAAEARAYHEAERKAFSIDERRRDLSRFAKEFYETRLGAPASRESRAALDAIADPDTLLIVHSHDGQLPHLGIVRMVLKAHDIASQDRKAVTLYLVGNHYTAAMKRLNLRFGMPHVGRSPDELEHPPKLPVENAQTPFRWLPPPSQTQLEDLRRKVDAFLLQNIGHEKRMGSALVPDAKERIMVRLHDLFGLLSQAARGSESFGDWLIRVQHDLFTLMLGPEAGRIVFLPMADMTSLFRGELTMVADRAEEVAAVKAAVSAEQIARGEEPYAREAQASSFWVHCPACYRRARQPWHPARPVEFECPFCQTRHRLEGEAAWKWTMPDIVAYEVALFRLGTDAWVVGSRASYLPAIERTYDRLFRSPMPPRFFQTSVPVFRGIGDPPEGYGRTRLLRALLEMDPAALAAGLRAPWEENPKLRSDLLGAP
jgi:hypothetical protein